MILELDVGNTRAKWRLVTGAGVIDASGTGDIDEWCLGLTPAAWSGGVGRIRIISVRGDDLLARLIAVLWERFGVRGEIAVVGEECSGVRGCYAEPGRLGSDRWAAMIAAFSEAQAAVLVADIGSALTIDLVDGDGLHRGGFIIPGPRLMRSILLAATDRVRFEQQEQKAVLEFGQDTGACVLNGAMLATVGAIQAAIAEATALLGDEPQLFLTGGYAQLLLEVPAFRDSVYRPDLVMDGLRYLLP